MSVRGLLFDLDATLYDHVHASRTANATMAARVPGLAALDPDELFARVQRILEDVHRRVLSGAVTVEEARLERCRRLLESIGENPAPGRVLELSDFRTRAYAETRRPVPGSRELLRAARARGLKIGIVSDNIMSEQEEKLTFLGMRDLVDVLVVSGDYEFTKPDPRIFGIALDKLGLAATETRMVGDNWEKDVEGAKASGITPVWFNPNRAPAPDPKVRVVFSFEPVEPALATIMG